MAPDPFSPPSSSLQPQTLVVSSPSDQRSVDGATLLSEDVYFDRENLLQNDNDEPLPSQNLQNLQVMTDLELGQQVMTDLELGQQENPVEEEIEFFPTEEEVPQREDGWELPIIEQHVEIDTISELSYEPHGHDFPMVSTTTPNPLTAENIAKLHTQPGTPVTVQMDPFHEKFPDLDDVNVTAYNSEGINIVESASTMKMKKKKSRCIFFVLVLIMVAAISLAIAVGVAQKRSSGRTTGASELEDVTPTIRPNFFDTPSASPTEELSGLQTKDPTIEETTMSPSFPDGTKPVGTNSPASFPTQAPSLAPEMDGQPSDFSKTSAPTTPPNDENVETETMAPTPNPTAEPSSKPTSTISVTNSPTPDPTREPTVSPTSPPTSRPTFGATESPTITEQTTEAPTDDPTETPTELSTTSTSTTSCLTQIGTSQTCYSRGTPIEVIFTNCDPKPSDWIGLYSDPEEINPYNLDTPRVWIYACGTRDCREEVTSNRIIFEIDWLPNGTYGTYLARGASSPPYTSIASHTFEVSDSCTEED